MSSETLGDEEQEMTTEYTAEQIAANRKKWTDALRSGDYKQTDSYLSYGGSYCCLGVGSEELGFPVALDDGSLMGVPVGGFLDATGLSGDTGFVAVFDPYGDIQSLANLNDEWGYTFDEIADLIDEGALIPREEESFFLYAGRLLSPIPDVVVVVVMQLVVRAYAVTS